MTIWDFSLEFWWYLPVAFVIWYVGYGLEVAINGGTLGRSLLLAPFSCFWEQMLETLPGGRAKWARQQADLAGELLRCGNYTYIGRRHSWDLFTVREQGLYAQMGKDCLPGPWHLFLWVVGPLLWPITLLVVLIGAPVVGGWYRFTE